MRTSLSDWKLFKESAIWADICDELEERMRFIVSKLIKGGDESWSDDNMRGRISEIEYMLTMVDFFINNLELSEKPKEESNGEQS